jgi:hypothetical protein
VAAVYVGVAGVASARAAQQVAVQEEVTPATSLENALPRNATGEDVFRLACSTCHALDGKGSGQNIVGFELPLPNGHMFPDFNDCPTNTVEPLSDWIAVVHEGGPIRALDRHMPAFGDALSLDQIQSVVKHLWSFCTDASWPRGDLNFPRAFFTEKAFPENEAVWTTGVTGRGQKAVTNTVVYEHRIKSRSQYEIAIPLGFQQTESGQPWAHGFGDMEIAVRRAFYASYDNMAIVAAGGAVTLPTGSEREGLGGGVTIWEPFAMFGKGIGPAGFVQMHAGIELPTDKSKATNETFVRTAFGYTFSQDRGFGRDWTPMTEILVAHPFGEGTEVDVVPQVQVSLSKLKHILLNVGARVPVTEREGRHPEFLTYFLWDWFDGGLFQFWK